MKKTVIVSLTFLAGVIAFAQAPEPTSGEAAAVLSATREALGEKRLSSIKTVVASGHTRQLQGYPLSFGHAGQAEAPEGKADVLDVKGGGNFAARFFIDSKTHLPLMLSWTTPPNLVPVVAGQKPPATLPPGSVTFETPMPRHPPDQSHLDAEHVRGLLNHLRSVPPVAAGHPVRTGRRRHPHGERGRPARAGSLPHGGFRRA